MGAGHFNAIELKDAMLSPPCSDGPGGRQRPHSHTNSGYELCELGKNYGEKRIGWIAGDAKLIDAFKKLKTNIDSGIPYFIQDAAIAALSDEKHVEENQRCLKEKRDIMVDAFVKAGLKNCSPKATFYIWQELPTHIDSMKLCKKLLQPEYGIVVTPGSMLTETIDGVNAGKNYIRLALVPTATDCKIAAEKIINVIGSTKW